jgi:asparagine synthase (glutamine-hydrolysing)
MCGIAGIWASSPSNFPGQIRTSKKMISTLTHRGPDDTGNLVLYENNLVFDFARLAFQDISSLGNQPMQSANWIIVFNGEIYNFKDLKKRCVENGWKFKSNSDTEVILSCLEIWGIDSINELDGMFAISAFDVREKELYLIRDPSGEKPLYWFKSKSNDIYFGSELRALEESEHLEFDIDESSIASYFIFQYIPAPRTIYRNVYKLRPGHYIKINKDRNVSEIKYSSNFVPSPDNRESEIEISHYVKDVKKLLLQSLERRIISDVPIGAFLSSGIDSSLVVALTRIELQKEIHTFSVGFENSPSSEHLDARLISEKLNTIHHEIIIKPYQFHFLEKIGILLDEPLADSSCLPVFELSNYTSNYVKGALSGDGGDELFAGYPRYSSLLREIETRPHADVFDTYFPLISIGSLDFVKELFGKIPHETLDHISSLKNTFTQNIKTNGALSSMRAMDHAEYLPGAVLAKVDRMSMLNSLEVRTPFLEKNLKNFAAKIPQEHLLNQMQSKLLLRNLSSQYLPEKISNLPKKGFGFPLTQDWTHEIYSRLNRIASSESGLTRVLGQEFSRRLVVLLNQERWRSPYSAWASIVLDEWLSARTKNISKQHDLIKNKLFSSIALDLNIYNTEVKVLLKNPIDSNKLFDIINRLVYFSIRKNSFKSIFKRVKTRIFVTDDQNELQVHRKEHDFSLFLDIGSNQEAIDFLKEFSIIAKFVNRLTIKIYMLLSMLKIDFKYIFRKYSVKDIHPIESNIIAFINGNFFSPLNNVKGYDLVNIESLGNEQDYANRFATPLLNEDELGQKDFNYLMKDLNKGQFIWLFDCLSKVGGDSFVLNKIIRQILPLNDRFIATKKISKELSLLHKLNMVKLIEN